MNGRNSNFEALRILAIIMITAYHYVVHGVVDPQTGGGIILYISSLWGKAGVDLFCLISGFMLITKNEIHYSKLKKIEWQVLFYTIGGLIVGMILHKDIGLLDIFYSIFPVISGHYWYITAYVLVFFLSPYLNQLVRSLDNTSFQRLLIICYSFWCIIPFFTLRENSGMFWSQFVWFVVMYITGAYIRLTEPKFGKNVYYISLVISTILLILSVVVLDWISIFYSIPSRFVTYFRWSNSPLIVIFCVSLMRIAAMLPKRSIGWVNFLASLVLGIRVSNLMY